MNLSELPTLLGLQEIWEGAAYKEHGGPRSRRIDKDQSLPITQALPSLSDDSQKQRPGNSLHILGSWLFCGSAPASSRSILKSLPAGGTFPCGQQCPNQLPLTPFGNARFWLTFFSFFLYSPTELLYPLNFEGTLDYVPGIFRHWQS